MQIIRDEIIKHVPTGSDARRIFHGRGHCFAGYEDLVIDAFPPVIMIILYRQRPENWLRELQDLLLSTLPDRPQAVLLQERFLPDSPNRLLMGDLPAELNALEAGLAFRLRLGEAQNVGFFLDMVAGRQFVREHSAGRKVLNLFAYSCSFSVAALAGGAAHVVNLDMNRGALELGKLNHRINNIDLRNASFLAMEFFRSTSKLRRLGPFDLVICDPPASQGKSFTASQHWPKLVRKLPGLMRPGGEVLACLNAPDLGPDYLDQIFLENIPGARRVELLSPGTDFPEASVTGGLNLHLYRLPEAID